MGLIGTEQNYSLAFVRFTIFLNSTRIFVQKLILLLLISVRKSKTKYPRSLSAQSKQLSISDLSIIDFFNMLTGVNFTAWIQNMNKRESTVSWFNFSQLISHLWWKKETVLQYKNLWKNTYRDVIFKLKLSIIIHISNIESVSSNIYLMQTNNLVCW